MLLSKWKKSIIDYYRADHPDAKARTRQALGRVYEIGYLFGRGTPTVPDQLEWEFLYIKVEMLRRLGNDAGANDIRREMSQLIDKEDWSVIDAYSNSAAVLSLPWNYNVRE